MNKHDSFIRTPIISLIQEAVSACSLSCGTMEGFVINDYVLPSLLLKMTGFNEQKLKCISWVIATDDYDYRYKLLNGKQGEMSNYKDKKDLFSLLLERIDNKDGLDREKGAIVQNCYSELRDLFEKSAFGNWLPREFGVYECIKREVSKAAGNEIVIKSNNGSYDLFKTSVSAGSFDFYKAYDYVYHTRNRFAHNLTSYQENLPSFKSLACDDYSRYENWFIRFFVLDVIDRLFVRVYEMYESRWTD